MKKTRRWSLIGCSLFVILFFGVAHAEYQMIELDLQIFGDSNSYATGINNLGQITGYSSVNGYPHPFLYDDGITIDLGTLGGNYSAAQAEDINDRGQVVGMSETSSWEQHAFLYSNGEMTDIGSNTYLSNALSINNKGQIVGVSDWHAFLYRNGVMTEIGSLEPAHTSIAFGINNNGKIAGTLEDNTGGHYRGSYAFIYDNGLITNIGTLGGRDSSARSINNSGQVVGWAETISGERHAFLYSNGMMKDLGTLGGPSSYANGINDKEQIVGESSTGDGDIHAFLYDNGIMIDLGGDHYSSAQDINNNGQIAGWNSDGSTIGRATLWNPVKTTGKD